MQILLTNDDSHRSPLLEIAIEYFSTFGDVTLVVPLHEQSWTGKSMTRFSPLQVQEIELFGARGWSVSGTPADCVNLGMYNLMSTKPDLVVSGINAGFNMGLGFVVSSGTVGACFEANIGGIPGIALSQAFDTATRNRYAVDYLIESETIARFRSHTKGVLDVVMGRLMEQGSREDFLACPITWNINLPFVSSSAEQVQLATLGATRYGRLFAEQHVPAGSTVRTFGRSTDKEIRDPSPTCDSSILDQQCAAITPLSLWSLTGDALSEQIARLAGRFASVD
jgi:5'-nucleotidase